jgi:hypothetical protein
MTTALAIITGALQELGVVGAGDSLSAEDSSVSLLALNVLADAWLTEPNYMYATTTVSASLSAGDTSLTIGASQDLNTARPIRLEQGCFVTSSGIDYPLAVITEAEYNAISDKSLSGAWPEVCFYDGGSPTGNVYFYPTGACTVKLNVLTQLSQFADLTTSYTLPPGYERAFKFTLAEEVANTFRAKLTSVTARNAKQARRAIKRANFVVPQLSVTQPVMSGLERIRAGL